MTDDLWKRISPAVILFLFFFSLYAFTMSGTIQYGDEIEKYRVAQSIVDRGDFSFRPTAMRNMTGVGGRTYSIYELGQTVAEVPLYALGRLVYAWFPTPDVNWITMLFVGFLNPLLTALTGVLLFRTCASLGFQHRTALILALVFGLGTIALPYSRSFTREPLLALLILLSVYALLRFQQTLQARWLVATGVAAGYLVFSKFIQGAQIPIFVAYVLFVVFQNQRRIGAKLASAVMAMARALLLFGLPAILFLLLQSLYALSRFGTIYGGIAGTKDNPIIGILSMLAIAQPDVVARLVFLSLEKSIFVYSPPVILLLVAWFAWARKKPSEAFLCLGLVLAAVITVLARLDGHGGDWWGPRYLVQITPLLIIPVGALLELSGRVARRFWIATLVLLSGIGFFVSAIGALTSDRDYLDITGKGTTLLGQIDFLRHGALDSLVLSLSPTGFPLQINPYGIVLLAVAIALGAWIVAQLRSSNAPMPASPRHGVALLVLVLAIEFAAFITWIVAPYPQVLGAKGNTRFVAANNFLAEGRSFDCRSGREARALYLMALDRGTTYQREAIAQLNIFLPRAQGIAVSAEDLIKNVEMPDNASVKVDESVTVSGEGSFKASVPGEKDAIVIATSDPIPALPNTAYELSGWMKTENIYGAGYGVVTLYEDDGNWGNGRTTDLASSDETHGWQPFGNGITTLATTKRVIIKASLWKTFGTVWVDGIQIAPVSGEKSKAANLFAPCAPASGK